MGHVFAGRRRRDRCPVAVKLLQPPLGAEARFREYMLHEADALTAGANPRLVQLLEFGETPSGAPYLVLEWLDGVNLGDVLAVEGVLPIQRVLHLFGSLLDAVEALHRRGVVHGDLKPDNLMLVHDADGAEAVWLIDLGAAGVGASNRSRREEVLGTPGYIAPELLLGEPLTVASDVYAAGVILFELITGTAPFEEELAGVVVTEPRRPPRPSDHRATGFGGLDAVVAIALADEPRQRFSSITALRAAFLAATDPHAAARPVPHEVCNDIPTVRNRQRIGSVR